MKPYFQISHLGRNNPDTSKAKDITPQLIQRCAELTFEDEVGWRSDHFSISFTDDGVLGFPRAGDFVALSIGYIEGGHGMVNVGKFKLDEAGYDLRRNTIDIRGSAIDQTLPIKIKRSANYDSQTIGELVALIAERHGLFPTVSSSLADVSMGYLQQVDESDIAFLNRLANDKYNAVAKVQDFRLIFWDKPTVNQTVLRQKLPPIEIDLAKADKCLELQYTSTTRPRHTGFKFTYYDRSLGKEVVTPVGDQSVALTISGVYSSKEEGMTLGQHKFDRNNLRKDSVSITVVGDAYIRAGRNLLLKNVRPGIPQLWFIERSTHTINRNGYKTSLTGSLDNSKGFSQLDAEESFDPDEE